MKKTIKFIFGICVASVLLASCEKFLDTTSYTDSNTSNFPASAEDAQQLVTGIYSTFNYSLYELCGPIYFIYANVVSDDEFGGGGADDIDIQAVDHLLYNDKNYFADYWTNCYTAIGRANMAIPNLDKVQDEKLRNQLIGEARILRAYYYFILTQMFEEVPLVTKVPQNVGSAKEYPKVGTVDEIYGFIAQDLKTAISIMPNDKVIPVTGPGHVTKWVAEGLLGRVYLFYTGFYSDKRGTTVENLPLYDVEEDALSTDVVTKKEVIDAINDCVTNSGHALEKDFRQLWGYSNEETAKEYPFMADCKGNYFVKDLEGTEDMFDICCGKSHHQENKMLYYVGLRQGSDNDGIFPMNRGYGFGPANPAFFKSDLWEDGDIRRVGSMFELATEAPDPSSYVWGYDNGLEDSGIYQKKAQAYAAHINGKRFFEAFSSDKYYGDGKKDLGRKYNPTNLTLMRFAEVLLMQSELTKTVDGLNKVRVRAGLQGLGSYTDSELRLERRRELAFEGLRWGDMRRYGKAYCVSALKSQLNQPIHNYGNEVVMKDQGAGYEARYNATYGFRDYPESEISLSNGALKQKDGWDNSAFFNSWK